MLLAFERGSQSEPKGHALAYVKNAADPAEIHATYLIVPPISIDLVKYMPPMFASKIPLGDMESLSAVPLPPMPEKVESLGYLQRLAELRGDDILNLGTMDLSDIQTVLSQIGDAAQAYLRAYTTYIESATVEPEPPRELPGLDVNEVLFSLMGEREKLGELAKLVGKLRYAVEGRDRTLEDETAAEMEALGRHLSDKFRVDKLIQAARTQGKQGQALTELYLSRCYKLSDEDYRAVEELDRQIREAGGG